MAAFFEGAVLIRYTRADALEDGTLVDVSQTARGAGFTIPVAVTAALWQDIEAIPEHSGQDVTGRLWDTLWMARLAVSQAVGQKQAEGPELHYGLMMPVAGQDFNVDEPYIVKIVIGPGDEEEPVFTLMKPDED